MCCAAAGWQGEPGNRRSVLALSNPLGWAAIAAGVGIGAVAGGLQWLGDGMGRSAARENDEARAKAARVGPKSSMTPSTPSSVTLPPKLARRRRAPPRRYCAQSSSSSSASRRYARTSTLSSQHAHRIVNHHTNPATRLLDVTAQLLEEPGRLPAATSLAPSKSCWVRIGSITKSATKARSAQKI